MQRVMRAPTFTRDDDGAEIVLVPLAGHDEPAKVLKSDFEQLAARGLSQNWVFNDDGDGAGRRYVKAHIIGRHKQLVTVARVILDPPRATVVRHKDGNRLNLRRDNLTLAQQSEVPFPIKHAREVGHAPGATLKDGKSGAAI